MEKNYKEMFTDMENKIKEINRKAKAEITELLKTALKTSAELFMEIGWDNWTEEQLESDGQYSRVEKAFSGKMKIESIDYKNMCGQVHGSTVYKVSKNGCECRDFALRKLPCKHMIFLAFQLSSGESSSEELQLTLDIAGDSAKDQIGGQAASERLGCCSLFRDCSRAGHCLQKDDYYKQCGYRTNLESGNVFYTENSNSFSKERYSYIENFRNSLGECERNAFDEVLNYFEKIKRGCRSCFCIFSPNIKEIIEKCDAFKMHSPHELVIRVFRAGLISNTRANEMFEKYSTLLKPELRPPLPPLDENANEKDKEERKKKNKTISDENLRIWEKHFLSDHNLQKALSEKFLYFQIADYGFELDEFFITNYGEVERGLKELVYYDASNPKTFRNKIE